MMRCLPLFLLAIAGCSVFPAAGQTCRSEGFTDLAINEIFAIIIYSRDNEGVSETIALGRIDSFCHVPDPLPDDPDSLSYLNSCSVCLAAIISEVYR